jgi:hypothetical protein
MFASSTELGITVFIGAKLGVYIAAGAALRRVYPETRAAAWIMALCALWLGWLQDFFIFQYGVALAAGFRNRCRGPFHLLWGWV